MYAMPTEMDCGREMICTIAFKFMLLSAGTSGSLALQGKCLLPLDT